MTPTRAKGPQTPRTRRHTADRITHGAENYLLSLFILREEDGWPTPAQLAAYIRSLPSGEGLGSSLPSVLGMVHRMAKEGLVEISPEHRVSLTSRGNALAEGVVRRHRLAECMVVDLLGLELYKAHMEAHRLEHGISSDVEAKIRERLGNPTASPFGHPIPGSGYRASVEKRLTMNNGKPGRIYLVDRIPEEDEELLRFLVEYGVVPGQPLSMVEAGHYRGVITFLVAQKEAALGLDAASRIWLRESDK